MNKEFIIGLIFGFLIPFLILFLISVIYPVPTGGRQLATLEIVKNNACQELSKDCSSDTNSIVVNGFDANKDGKIDSNDTLFELCKNWYGCEDESCCKVNVCGCP